MQEVKLQARDDSTAASVSKPWLQSYPPGVPAMVDTTVYKSLVELLEEAFHKHAQRDAAVCMDQSTWSLSLRFFGPAMWW